MTVHTRQPHSSTQKQVEDVQMIHLQQSEISGVETVNQSASNMISHVEDVERCWWEVDWLILLLLPGSVSKLNPCTGRKQSSLLLNTCCYTIAGLSSPIQYSTVPITESLNLLPDWKAW